MEDFKSTKAKMEAEMAAKRMMGQMMIDMILESDAPESMKADMRIMQAMQQLDAEVKSLVEKVTLDKKDTYSVQNKKDVMEYLLLVTEGVKGFVKTLDEQIANSKED